MELFFALIGGVITFIFTALITKKIILGNFVSVDLHKEKKQKISALGGIAVAFGFVFSIIAAYLINGGKELLLVLFAFLITASIGLADDFKKLSPLAKLSLAGCAALPFIFMTQNIFYLIILFVIFSVASNWTNMLAGFNGLEAGLGFIAAVFLSIGAGEGAAFVFFVYASCLLAFLFFNRYPAKVFPGNVGTMPIGTVLVAGVLLGASFAKFAILMLPFFMDALLKFWSVGVMDSSNFAPSKVRDGYLMPQKRYLSLATLLIRVKKLKEWQLIGIIWGIEIALGAATLRI